MVGNNSASILVDAYMKGVKVDDIKTMYEGLLHGTVNVHPEVSSTGRLGHEYYNKLGYIPYDVKITRMLPAHWNMHTTTGVSINWPKN